MSDASADADIRVICGPTGAGKSAIAMWPATRYPCAIICADSRQIYRGFDIGTAKPSRADRTHVPHFGVDVAGPTERYSAATWCAAAAEWIECVRTKGLIPLVVAGTGLYIRALFEGLFTEPPMDVTKRAALAAALRATDTCQLRRWTRELDPARAHLGRTQLLRAVEVALLSGVRISDLQAATTRPPGWRPYYLVVDPGAVLATRNAARTDAMIATGWVDEVRGLTHTVPADAPAWKSTGYAVMRQHALGEIDLARARERVVIETRQYVKRQRTWFRHQLPPEAALHLDPGKDDWERVVEEWWIATEGGGR